MADQEGDLSTTSSAQGEQAVVPESKLCSRVLNNVELTALIFGFLKDITYKEAGIVDDGNSVPVFPNSWTQIFAQLALVNRTFFHESISVLWEKMRSPRPFFELLLPADRSDDGGEFQPLAYAMNSITSEHWRRFTEYATRTKVLLLERHDGEELNCGWLLHLAMSKLRPDPLFPALDHLILTSTDSLSMLVAISSAPKAKRVSILLDDKSDEKKDEAVAAITASIYGANCELVDLRILHPTIDNSLFIMSNIAQLSSITTLTVNLPCRFQSADFRNLARCRSLKQLTIGHVLPPDDLTSSSVGFWPSSVNISEDISRPSSFPHLAFLAVACNALAQLLIARRLSPKTLRHLALQVKLDGFDDQQILLPHTLAIHAARNPSLEILEITCPLARSMSAESVASRRGDWQYINFTQLWTNLSSLKSLTSLTIVDVPFLCTDILDRLLDVVVSLPVLEVAILSPRQMTDLEADELSLPPLHRLEGISRHNARLVRLSIAMGFETIPAIPKGYISCNPLRSLSLCPPVNSDLSLSDFDNQELFLLGRYLDRLFPHLECLNDGQESGSKSWLLWDYVEGLVHSFQDLRAQTALDLQASASSAMEVDS